MRSYTAAPQDHPSLGDHPEETLPMIEAGILHGRTHFEDPATGDVLPDQSTCNRLTRATP